MCIRHYAMAGGLGPMQCKQCLEEGDIEVKVVDWSMRYRVFFLGCEVYAVPRIATNVTKRTSCRIGHPVRHPLRCWAAPKRNRPCPPSDRVWAATIALVRW